jgi:transposase
MSVSACPSGHSDAEEAILVFFISPAKSGGRPRSVDIRGGITGILHMLRTGCAWLYLPDVYGSWPIVYGYFWQCRSNHLLEICQDNLANRCATFNVCMGFSQIRRVDWLQQLR